VPNFKILAVFSLKSLKVTLKLNENAFIKWARIKKEKLQPEILFILLLKSKLIFRLTPYLTASNGSVNKEYSVGLSARHILSYCVQYFIPIF
jgi:hypothetical protein